MGSFVLSLASPVSQSQRPSRKSVFSVFSGITSLGRLPAFGIFCGSITAWGSALFSLFGKQSATCVLVLIQEHQFPLKVQHFFQYNHSWAPKIQILDQKRGCAPKEREYCQKNRKADITKAAPKELAPATTYKQPSKPEQELPFVNQLLKALFFCQHCFEHCVATRQRFSGSTPGVPGPKPQQVNTGCLPTTYNESPARI